MTFATIIDVVVHRAGDDSGAYRAQVRNWLNLVRAKVAGTHSWRSAVDSTKSITTSSATTTGLYSIGADIETVLGQYMYDQTNDTVLQVESLASLRATDVDKSTTGTPDFWADAGMNSSGGRLIYLWPIPSGTYTVQFQALKRVLDIEESDEGLTVDPFFGSILPWAECFEAGLDYYYDKDSNEDANQVLLKMQHFERAISRRKASEGAAVTSARVLANVRQPNSTFFAGRFPPAHYSNRGS